MLLQYFILVWFLVCVCICHMWCMCVRCMWGLEETIGCVLLFYSMALIQMDWMTCDRCVKWVPRRDCDQLLLFKQEAPDSWSLFIYKVSLIWMNNFKSSFLLPKFLKTDIIITFVPFLFALLCPSSPTGSHYSFELYIYHQKHWQFCKLQRNFSN